MADNMISTSMAKLPAHIRGRSTAVVNPFAAAVSAGGFPVVSIKGKVFHVQRGDERTLVTNPKGDDGEPASYLEVIIVASNPNRSKVYYSSGYEEGFAGKPDCYSNDGIAPAADAENPQSNKCAICPHAQWGSRIMDNGNKGKACADSMRLAISPAGQINDPMLLRVPAASLKALGAYGSQLAKRGVLPRDVVTRIGFDYNVAYPALTFKAVRFVTADEAAEVDAVLDEDRDVIANITGETGSLLSENERMADEAAGGDETTSPAETQPETSPKPKPKPEPEPEPEPEAEASSVDDYDDIDAALADLDFDD